VAISAPTLGPVADGTDTENVHIHRICRMKLSIFAECRKLNAAYLSRGEMLQTFGQIYIPCSGKVWGK
jgi:hypothetical protein